MKKNSPPEYQFHSLTPMQNYTSRPSIVSVLSTASGIVQLARKSLRHLFGQKKNSAQSHKP
jgi:hypothetical protein